MPDEVSLLQWGGGLVIVPALLKKLLFIFYSSRKIMSGLVVYLFDKNLLFYMLHIAK